MGFPDGHAAYEQKKRELHAKLDQTKKVSLLVVGIGLIFMIDHRK